MKTTKESGNKHTGEKRYWLLKSEADCYSIDAMSRDKKTLWTGIRNYQARNFMRDNMRKGDEALFYHSGQGSKNPPAVVGVVSISKEAVVDPGQFDPKSEYFDAKATKEHPIWHAVEVTFQKKFKRPVTLFEIKLRPDLEGIPVAAQGSRLSVQPVTKKHFEIIAKLGEEKA